MNYIGFDLGKTASQICCLTETGELIEKRLKTEREELAQFFGRLSQSRILLEASTESEWVAQFLEDLGHEVVVADPNFAPMYATLSKKIKTDKRDARALCDACRLGAYRAAHRTSGQQRERRRLLTVRETMVKTRSRYVSVIRALLRGEGRRALSGGSTAAFAKRIKEMQLPTQLFEQIEPLLILLEALNQQIAAADAKLAQIVAQDETVQRLATMPGIGAVTAVSFVAAIDAVERFADAKQVRSYLGLVPREHSSGERQHRGSISKTGNSRLRTILVEVSWGILCRKKNEETGRLREWAERIAERRGKKIAVVALARKLAGVLYAMWRDKTSYSAAIGGAKLSSQPTVA